jgi:hypothetical protein
MAGEALSAHEESKLKMRKAMADVTLVDEVIITVIKRQLQNS